jgi:hypothetical protein
LALVCEKTVSFIRNAVDSGGKFPTYVWNLLAMVVGVAMAIGWELNLAPAVLALIPHFATSSALDGTAGQILSGLAIGGASGFAYGILQALEATVTRNRMGTPPQ